MTTNNNGEKYWKLAKIVNTMLLCSHIYLIIMFFMFQVRLMVFVNIVSILVYLFNYYWIKRNLHVFFGNAYIEILLHMILAYLCVGWNSGFQIYTFALILTVYYCDYLGQKIKKPSLHPRTVSILAGVLYLAFYFIRSHAEPFYDITKWHAGKIFFVINATFVLVYIIFFMENYRKIVTGTEKQLEEAARRDELTQMENRRSMQERFDRLPEIAGTDAEVGIAILDIDDFKKVNDTYGHDAGDMILHEVAQRILAAETEEIHTCRWGGEEFLILAVGKMAYPSLVNALQKILGEVRADRHDYHETDIMVTISAGAAKHKPGEKIEHTISRADDCLYQAKENGKDRMEVS